MICQNACEAVNSGPITFITLECWCSTLTANADVAHGHGYRETVTNPDRCSEKDRNILISRVTKPGASTHTGLTLSLPLLSFPTSSVGANTAMSSAEMLTSEISVCWPRRPLACWSKLMVQDVAEGCGVEVGAQMILNCVACGFCEHHLLELKDMSRLNTDSTSDGQTIGDNTVLAEARIHTYMEHNQIQWYCQDKAITHNQKLTKQCQGVLKETRRNRDPDITVMVLSKVKITSDFGIMNF